MTIIEHVKFWWTGEMYGNVIIQHYFSAFILIISNDGRKFLKNYYNIL